MTVETLSQFARSISPAVWAGVTTAAAAIVTAGCCWRGRQVTKQLMVTYGTITDAKNALKPTRTALKVGAAVDKTYLLSGDRKANVRVEFPSEQALESFLTMEKKKQVEARDPLDATTATLIFKSVGSLPNEAQQQLLTELFPKLRNLQLSIPSGPNYEWTTAADWQWTVRAHIETISHKLEVSQS